jgi:hypothetical protein
MYIVQRSLRSGFGDEGLVGYSLRALHTAPWVRDLGFTV